MQTPLLHADIRIPADRPAFTNKLSLDDFSLNELKLLAKQKGFAGETSVAGNSCHWKRQIDYQPSRDQLDIGYMHFNGNRILETGSASNYAEVWEQLPESRGTTYAFRFVEKILARSPEQSQAGMLVVSGDYFSFIRDRLTTLPTALSLDNLLSEASSDRQRLYELMDFEISFGRIAKGNMPWEIQLSTLPFREGKQLFTIAEWTEICHSEEDYIQQEQAWNGMIIRRWIV